ncbi:MAG: Holliday junction branch migration protein RuvA [Deltaproteobacteria bacterium]
MIAALRGTILFRNTNRVIVDVQGVGYEVSVSIPTMESLPDDGEVFFHVHTALRENSLELYGFTAEGEKALFEMLLGVSGIGPRMALTILSGISPDRFQKAILQSDLRSLTAVSGIGKKTAERIILELKEKIKKISIFTVSEPGVNVPASLEEDLVSSLLNLGYREREATAAAKTVLTNCTGEVSLSNALKRALRELMK